MWTSYVCGDLNDLRKQVFPAKTNQNMCDCVLCFSSIEKQSDRNLVRGRGKFNVYEEIISLQFTVHETSRHICKQCLRKLQKRRGLRTNLRELDDEIFKNYSSKAYKAGLPIKKKAVQLHDLTAEKSVSPEKRILLEESSDCYSACNKGNRRCLHAGNSRV